MKNYAFRFLALCSAAGLVLAGLTFGEPPPDGGSSGPTGPTGNPGGTGPTGGGSGSGPVGDGGAGGGPKGDGSGCCDPVIVEPEVIRVVSRRIPPPPPSVKELSLEEKRAIRNRNVFLDFGSLADVIRQLDVQHSEITF